MKKQQCTHIYPNLLCCLGGYGCVDVWLFIGVSVRLGCSPLPQNGIVGAFHVARVEICFVGIKADDTVWKIRKYSKTVKKKYVEGSQHTHTHTKCH